MWMMRDFVSQNNGEAAYDDSTRIGLKRTHHRLTNISDPELGSAKKQAVDGAGSRFNMGIPFMNMPPWLNSARPQSFSGHFNDRLFGLQHVQTADSVARNVPFPDGQNARKSLEEQYYNASSIDLSTSHTVDDTSSSLNLDGFSKAEVNQAQDFNINMHETLGLNLTEGQPRSFDEGATQGGGENNTIFSGRISMGPFVSTHQNFANGASYFTSTRELSTYQPFVRVGDNLASFSQLSQMTDSDLISMGPTFVRRQDNFISMPFPYGKATENLFSVGLSSNKRDVNLLSVGQNSNMVRTDIPLMVSGQEKGDMKNIIGSHGRQGTMLNLPGSVIRNGAETCKEIGQNAATQIIGARVNGATEDSKTELKAANKVSSNTFPSNVKTLLSTGIFDGVPVKYYSWSREKSLKGIIKGSGYVCSCSNCNSTKILNAFEFERHANCKTKHPNNHIYFEKGKTVYGVVQELRKAPQSMLFDVIQNVTGSPINQKNFNAWKASYEAATQELQRIYGKD